MRSIAGLVMVVSIATGCVPTATSIENRAAPVPARGEAVATAHRCGVALGLAARCDLLRDDRDFAVLRFAMIQGLGRRFAATAEPGELAEILDLASLDRIGAIGQCRVPQVDALRLETGVRAIVDRCVGP